MTRWAILTGEYPPQPGGVSDYTALLARRLAAQGDSVQVFAPPGVGPPLYSPAVDVDVLPGRFGLRSLLRLDQSLSANPPDRILLQYVPQGFGWKAMNLPFATWIATRARRIAPVWVMFHEVVFPFTWRPVKHAILGGATQVMARLVAGAADRVFVSIPAWGKLLRQLHPRIRAPEWLPVPSTLDTGLGGDIPAVRSMFAAPETPLVGHFGTFGGLITDLLTPSLVELLRLMPQTRILLVGRGSVEFAARFKSNHPKHALSLEATGGIPNAAVGAYLQACDVLLQPFPDGVSSRRTSVMAGLASGATIVTNMGFLSEPLWACDAVAAAPSPDPIALANLVAGLLTDPTTQNKLGQQALKLYRDSFAVEHTISKLRGSSGL